MANTPAPEFLTLAEAALVLRCSVRTMHRRIAEGFPAIKVGGDWRSPRAALARLVQRAEDNANMVAPRSFTMSGASRGGRR